MPTPDAPTPEPSAATPVERWGTCCPFDPKCDHSFLDEAELYAWLRRPLTDREARELEVPDADT